MPRIPGLSTDHRRGACQTESGALRTQRASALHLSENGHLLETTEVAATGGMGACRGREPCHACVSQAQQCRPECRNPGETEAHRASDQTTDFVRSGDDSATVQRSPPPAGKRSSPRISARIRSAVPDGQQHRAHGNLGDCDRRAEGVSSPAPECPSSEYRRERGNEESRAERRRAGA